MFDFTKARPDLQREKVTVRRNSYRKKIIQQGRREGGVLPGGVGGEAAVKLTFSPYLSNCLLNFAGIEISYIFEAFTIGQIKMYYSWNIIITQSNTGIE